MKKSVLLALIAIAIAAALFSILRPERAPWTTSSPAALEEFQLGREAVMRLHHVDAREHFNRALELDPDFAAARLMAYRVKPYDEREELLSEVRRIDTSKLLDHERFLIEYELALVDGDEALTKDLLEAFLTEHPRSPWGLEKKAQAAWGRFDFATAEKYYQTLLEAEPNWVTAENNLGYIAMSRGDFDAAEEHFRTYQYIAPDQANPHDSRGELLTLVGDYEEAWKEFDAALEIRPDFCASYSHQLALAAFAGFEDRVPGVVEAAREHCSEAVSERLNCYAQLIADYLDGNPEIWFEERGDDCLERVRGSIFLHRMAVLEGNREIALACEEKVGKQQDELAEQGAVEKNPAAGFYRYLEGSRLLAEGQVEAAIERLSEADERLFYMGHDVGLAKLLNLMDLSIALELAGQKKAARERLEDLLAVNPQMQRLYDERKRELAFLFERA